MTQHDQTKGNETMTESDDAIAMLHADHRQICTLFQQYAETPDPYLKQIIAEHVFAEMELHMLLEETLLYPAYTAQAGEAGQHDVAEALHEHQQVRDCIAALQDIDDDATFEVTFQVLRDQMVHHIEDEEATMFPQAAQVLAAHMAELTALMQERKAQILAS